MCQRKSTSGIKLLVFFTFINFFLKTFINQKYNLLPDCACFWTVYLYVCCEKCMSGFSAFVLTGIILFRSMPNGNCLFSSASLSLVADNSLVHELRVMAAVSSYIHLNATYAQYLALKSVYEKNKYVMGGKLFSSYKTVFELVHEL